MGSCGSQEVSIKLGKDAIPSCSIVKEKSSVILFYSESSVSSYESLLRQLPKGIISKITKYYSESLEKPVLLIEVINPSNFEPETGVILEICNDSVLIQISAIRVVKLLMPEDKEIEAIFSPNRPMNLKTFLKFIEIPDKVPTIKEAFYNLKKALS